MKTDFRMILFLASLALIVSNARAFAHTDVTPEQARELIDSTEDLVVVDVRERSEYCDARGHIPGALNRSAPLKARQFYAAARVINAAATSLGVW
jgi:3-mercaptopyruvate sulfurtransferase SseA